MGAIFWRPSSAHLFFSAHLSPIPIGNYQGPRNLTIMATITINSYYALRNNCPIMESGSRDRSPIIVPYYEKKNPITLNSTLE